METDTVIEKNLELSFEFTRYLFEHPEIDDMIPRGAQIVILPEYNEELKEYNLKLAKLYREEGQPIVYVKIKKLLPLKRSRLEETEIELAV